MKPILIMKMLSVGFSQKALEKRIWINKPFLADSSKVDPNNRPVYCVYCALAKCPVDKDFPYVYIIRFRLFNLWRRGRNWCGLFILFLWYSLFFILRVDTCTAA